jgi:hypothetical protein
LNTIDKDKDVQPTDVSGTQYETVVWDMSKSASGKAPDSVKSPEPPQAAAAVEKNIEKTEKRAEVSPESRLAEIDSQRVEVNNRAARTIKRIEQLEAIKSERPLETTEFIEFVNAAEDKAALVAEVNQLNVASAENGIYADEKQKEEAINLSKVKRLQDAMSRASQSRERISDIEREMKTLADVYKNDRNDALFQAALDELIDLRSRQMQREKAAREALEIFGVKGADVVAAAEKIAESPEVKKEELIVETGTPAEMAAEIQALTELIESSEKLDVPKSAETKTSPLKKLYTLAKKFFEVFRHLIDGKSMAEKQRGLERIMLEKNPLADFARFKVRRDVDGRIDLVERYFERLATLKTDRARALVRKELTTEIGWINNTLNETNKVLDRMNDGPMKTQEMGKYAAQHEKLERVLSEFDSNVKVSRKSFEQKPAATEAKAEVPEAEDDTISPEVANAETQELTRASTELQRELAELRETNPEVAARKKSLLDRLNGFTRGVKLRYLKGVVRPIKHAYRNARANQDEELAPEYRSASTPATERRPGLKPKKGETVQEAARRQREERAAYAEAGETQEISPRVIAELNKERAANEDEAELARQIDAAGAFERPGDTPERAAENERYEKNVEAAITFTENISNFLAKGFDANWSQEDFERRIGKLTNVDSFGDRDNKEEIARVLNRLMVRTALNEKMSPEAKKAILTYLEKRNYITTEKDAENGLRIKSINDEGSETLREAIQSSQQ